MAMEDLFIGGLLPGILMLGMLALLASRGGQDGATRTPFGSAEAVRSMGTRSGDRTSVVVMVALLGGYATPVESAALAALYAFIMQRFIHRDLPRIEMSCASLASRWAWSAVSWSSWLLRSD